MERPAQKYVNALLTNDTSTLKELYREFAPRNKRMILQYRGTKPEAEDVFQDCLESIYNRAKNGKLDPINNFGPYFHRACWNKWQDQFNNYNKIFKKTNKNLAEYFSENYFETNEESTMQKQRRNLFVEKFAELRKASQEFLLLCWRIKSMKKVARTMNITPGYARKKKCEIVKKLETLIKQSREFALLKR